MTNYEIAMLIWVLIGLGTFLYLFRMTAPYGRHKVSGWGFEISNQLSWFLMEGLCPLFISYWFWTGPSPKTSLNIALYSLYIFHYVYRGWVFPFITRTNGKTMPISITSMAVVFNLINTFFIGYQLGFLGGRETISIGETVLGLMLFAFGFYTHFKSDQMLIHLRKPGETGYKIPYGFMFNYVSSPNYFGEIIQWTGFAILLGAPAGWLFVFWTGVNLIPRAVSNHKWYKEKFADYPKERKAMFPYVF